MEEENKKDKTIEQTIENNEKLEDNSNLNLEEENNPDEIADEKNDSTEEHEESNLENNVEEKTNSKRVKIKKVLLISLIVILLLMFFSTIFAILNIDNEKIISGTKIEGINVSKLTREEAYQKISERLEIIRKQDIQIKYNDYTKNITPEQLEIDINIKDVVEEAYKIGRNNNIIIDNYQILLSSIFKKNLKLSVNYNEEILKGILKTIEEEIPGKMENYSYEIDKDKLIITNGKEGLVVEEDKLKESILNKIIELLNEEKKDNTIIIQAKNQKPEKIDIEKVYNEIYKEPEDAYISEDPFEIHVEQSGLDFDITMEEAKKIIGEDKEQYEIPLKITEPNKTVSDLGEKVFKESLSKFTTVFDVGNTNRASNIALATKTLDGIILKPGEVFSYNKVIGNTTKEKGYKLGGAYVNGQVVQAYGGGICQVSTTLYNAVLYANLEIVQRYNHTYAVSYVPAGRDATVSYGGKDFKFKNNRKYPIKIEGVAKNGTVSISIKGIKEENEYEIQLESKVLSRTPCNTVYQNTNSMEEGKQKIIQKGYNGYKSITYKITKQNGKIINKETLSSDTYLPMNKIVMVGTKKNTTTKQENKNDSEKNEQQKTETNTQDNLEP